MHCGVNWGHGLGRNQGIRRFEIHTFSRDSPGLKSFHARCTYIAAGAFWPCDGLARRSRRAGRDGLCAVRRRGLLDDEREPPIHDATSAVRRQRQLSNHTASRGKAKIRYSTNPTPPTRPSQHLVPFMLFIMLSNQLLTLAPPIITKVD